LPSLGFWGLFFFAVEVDGAISAEPIISIATLGDMHMNTRKLWIALILFAATLFPQTLFAQGLNWEGQTGALLTPFAYTAA